jgi:hypothetical protein
MKIKDGFRFRDAATSGMFIERLPPEYWDNRNDPEWIVKYDASSGGKTVCEPESKMRQYEVIQVHA